jgi:hypothetical protein
MHIRFWQSRQGGDIGGGGAVKPFGRENLLGGSRPIRGGFASKSAIFNTLPAKVTPEHSEFLKTFRQHGDCKNFQQI